MFVIRERLYTHPVWRMHKRKKASLSEPQNPRFNYITRSITLHKTFWIYIHFWKCVFSNHGWPTGATRTHCGVSQVLSGLISMFVFDILRTPIGCNWICGGCNALVLYAPGYGPASITSGSVLVLQTCGGPYYHCVDKALEVSTRQEDFWHCTAPDKPRMPHHSPFNSFYCAAEPVKADLHIACRAHAVPLPCRAAKGLECVFPIWFTQCGRVWFTLAMPCSDHAVLLKATAQCHLRETACGRRACYRLPPATTRSSRKVVIRSILISVAGGQCETKQRLL